MDQRKLILIAAVGLLGIFAARSAFAEEYTDVVLTDYQNYVDPVTGDYNLDQSFKPSDTWVDNTAYTELPAPAAPVITNDGFQSSEASYLAAKSYQDYIKNH